MGVVIDVDRIEDLRIWEYLENSSMGYSLEDVAQTDVTLIGMTQTPWTIEKGMRTQREYLNDLSEVVVRFTYTYDLDSNLQIVSVNRSIQYMDLLGEIGVEKDILKDLSDTQIISLNREVRQNQIDDLRGRGGALRATAVGLPEPAKSQYIHVADSVDLLWEHYNTDEYVKTGGTSFKDAVENETDPTILAILAIVVTAEGTTVDESILFEIS